MPLTLCGTKEGGGPEGGPPCCPGGPKGGAPVGGPNGGVTSCPEGCLPGGNGLDGLKNLLKGICA